MRLYIFFLAGLVCFGSLPKRGDPMRTPRVDCHGPLCFPQTVARVFTNRFVDANFCRRATLTSPVCKQRDDCNDRFPRDNFDSADAAGFVSRRSTTANYRVGVTSVCLNLIWPPPLYTLLFRFSSGYGKRHFFRTLFSSLLSGVVPSVQTTCFTLRQFHRCTSTLLLSSALWSTED